MAFKEQMAGQNSLLLLTHLALGIMEGQLRAAAADVHARRAQVHARAAAVDTRGYSSGTHGTLTMLTYRHSLVWMPPCFGPGSALIVERGMIS